VNEQHCLLHEVIYMRRRNICWLYSAAINIHWIVLFHVTWRFYSKLSTEEGTLLWGRLRPVETSHCRSQVSSKTPTAQPTVMSYSVFKEFPGPGKMDNFSRTFKPCGHPVQY